MLQPGLHLVPGQEVARVAELGGGVVERARIDLLVACVHARERGVP